MGMERVMASSKLDRESAEFLDDMAKSMRPYEVSQSSLMNLCVRIVKRAVERGDLSLEPRRLQELLGTESRPGTRSRSDESGRPSTAV